MTCTYKFTEPDGTERTITGKAAMKAYLAGGGLDAMLPDWGKSKTAFSFAGQRSANASIRQLDSAKDRIKAGDDPEVVRQDTGWHQGFDGKWRYEISDEDATLKAPFPNKGQRWGDIYNSVFESRVKSGALTITVGDLLHHPALFAAYPDVANIPVSTKKGDGASYIVASSIDPASIQIGEDEPMYSVRSILLHELQHGIQTIEGFANGGSLESRSGVINALTSQRDFWAEVAALRRELDNGAMEDQIKSDWRESMDREPLADAFRMAKDPELKTEVAIQNRDQLESQLQGIKKENRSDTYRRLAGEVEARNTQSRQNLTEAERRATPPNQTADVAANDVIVMFNGKVMDNAPTPANSDLKSKPTKESDIRLVSTQQIVDAIASKWTRTPEIIVARNMQDTLIPKAVRDYDAVLKSQGATGEPRGFIYQGQVFVLSDEVRGTKQIAEVLFHEVLGHYGLRGAFGDSLNNVLNKISTMRRKDVEAKAKEYGLDMSDPDQRLQAAEEVLAEMAQTRPNISFVKQAIAAIRNWLRANVPGMQSMRLTDADILQAYLLPARGFVERGERAARGDVGAAFSRDGDYRGSHRAPSAEYGSRADNLEPAFSDSIYTSNALHEHGHGIQADREALRIIKAMRGKPDSMVTIYRAVPNSAGNEIQPGDWVTTTRAYATNHGDAVLDGKFKIISKTVTAGSLFNSGDIHEFGYHPLSTDATGEDARFNRAAKDQTQTEAFKKWFGDSKVVDAKGNPLVVYHGTNADFVKFSEEKIGRFDNGYAGHGFYFAKTPMKAGNYARDNYGMSYPYTGSIMPVYLRMENPIDSESMVDEEMRAWVEDNINSQAVEPIDDGFSSLLDSMGIDLPEKSRNKVQRGTVRGMLKYITQKELTQYLMSRGYDGILFFDEFVVFSPSQIKSAIGNNGEFDPSNPDIRFSRTIIAGQNSRQHTPRQLQAMRNIGQQVDVPTMKERAQALWQDAGKKLTQGVFDQFAPIKELGGNAYTLTRLMKGASGAFETILHGGKLKLEDGVYNFDKTQRGGLMEKLMMPLHGEHHDFLRWVAANRAEGLMDEGRENLFTLDDIEAFKTLADDDTEFDYTIQNGVSKGKVTRNRLEIYKDALVTFNGFQKNVMDMYEQSGGVDPEARKAFEREFYLPFYRVEDEGGIRGATLKGGIVRQDAIKKLKGGKNKLNFDLLDNTLMNWASLLDAAAKNRAAKATLDTATQLGKAIEAPEATVREMGASIGNKKGVVWYMDGGKKRYFLVDDPYLLTAITALDYSGMKGPIMDTMSFFKHALTMGVTASPFFKVRNLIRDSVQVIATGPISYNPAGNIKQGWKLTDPRSDEYFSLLSGGGTIHFGTMYEGSEAKRVQALVEAGVDKSTILDSEDNLKTLYRKAEKVLAAYNELGNRSEAVNRAALYDQLVKQGLSHADASLQARDLMDFSMQGSFATVRFLSQVVPFMNARLQGMYKLGRGAKEDPQRFATVLGATALMSLGLLAAYHDDDDWKKRPDWDRNNYWWFKFGDTAYRIPKPFEIGAIATLAERSAEYIFDQEMTGKRFREQILKLTGDQLSMNPIPQAVKPILDIYANKDSFRGTQIESDSMEKLRPEYRFNDKTSMAARGISTAGNTALNPMGINFMSPVQVDHLLRGYFGWLGTFAVQASDMIARPATGQVERASTDQLNKWSGGMAAGLSDAQSRYVNQMYEQAREVEQAYSTYRQLQKEGKTAESSEFLDDNRDTIALNKPMGLAKRQSARLNEQIRMIERSDADGDTKREQIRVIRQQQDRLARVNQKSPID